MLHRNSSGALCATDEANAILLRKGYDKPTAVVPYGMRSQFFIDRKPERDPSRPFTIGYIGRLLMMNRRGSPHTRITAHPGRAIGFDRER